MERLTGLDAAFLWLETPTNHMHVMGVAVLDPTSLTEPFTRDRIKELIASRIHLLPPFRRRLVAVPFQLHNPLWVEDPDFDLDYHVWRVAVPAPGGPNELAELTADIASRQLDRTRPLWELWVVEGLENGHVAIITKVHHSAIDGASGVELMAHLFDTEPSALNPPMDESASAWHPDRIPSEIEMLLGAVQSIARQPLLMVKAMRNAISSAVKLTRRIRSGADVSGGTPFGAPRTSLNQVITPRRKVAFASMSLDDVKLVKNAFGVTVNDVVLSVCAGALRRFLEAGGELPDRPLVATVPTTVRSSDQRGKMGNRVSAMFTSLAVNIEDPIARLLATRAVMSGAKLVHEDIGGSTLQEWAEVASPRLMTRAARLYSQLRIAERHPPIHNLVISNVPGPPFPLYMAGARLVSMFPMGPIFDGAALNVTVLSYLESVDWGFMACRETVPRLDEIAAAIPDALAELVKAAESLQTSDAI